MTEPASGRGGIDNRHGVINTGGGDAVAGNKTNTTTTIFSAPVEVHRVLQPIAHAVATAPPELHSKATAKFDQLRAEVSKGDKAEDTTVATLLKGLVQLVPSAVSAVVGAFGTPILSGVAGPVTKFVLRELGQANDQ